jgi:hypothetical protein
MVYEFHVLRGAKEIIEQKGPSKIWEWRPEEAGFYRVKVIVRDALGKTADSGWSAGFEITKELGQDSLIVVFPMENLSGIAAPVREIQTSFEDRMKRKGLKVLDVGSLEKFMAQHRMRYAGGLTGKTGQALRKETGADAVLAMSIDLYSDGDSPRVAFTARLVSTGEKASIRWMDSVVMAGKDSPGILGIGIVRDFRVLRDRAMIKILNSMDAYLSSGRSGAARKHNGRDTGVSRKGRFRPKEFYRPQDFAIPGRKAFTVAVLPFFNDSTRKNAGEIVRLQFLRHLVGRGDVVVLDPGEVRQAILHSRMILEGGVSLPQAAFLREILDVDLVFYGSVREYKDSIGSLNIPEVNFSNQAIDTNKKKVIWSSTSYNTGGDRVFFFDWGKVSTAHAMASEMVNKVIERILGAPIEAGEDLKKGMLPAQ